MAKNGAKTAERAAFIEWWFTVGRDPKTQTEWADQYKVNIHTVSEWKRSAEFIARQDAYRTIFRPDFIDATRVMLGLAKRGDVPAYRAVMDALGEKAPEQLNVSVDRVAYADPNALAQLAVSRFPELAERAN